MNKYKRLSYRYCCVSPTSLKELQFIIDNSIEIKYNTFIKHVDTDKIKEFNTHFSIHIDKDCNVTFHKSKLKNGEPAYYFKHSAIEHIFY